MRYWSFQSNPLKYRIEDAVRELSVDSWATKGHDISAGDRAIIWKASGGTGVRGVLAFATVKSDPMLSRDIYGTDYVIPPLKTKEIQSQPEELRVTIAYLSTPILPLWAKGPQHNIVSALQIYGGDDYGRQVTVIEESREQFERVVAAAGGWPGERNSVRMSLVPENQRAIEEAVNSPRKGQGFLVDTAARRAIETYAMGKANEYYSSRGWQVRDVSSYQPYDLHCAHPDGRELRVEVKGTSTDGSGVLLTRNEVKHAQAYYPYVALFIVANIMVQPSGDGAYITSGGRVVVREPWNLNTDDLTALAYSYRVPDR